MSTRETLLQEILRQPEPILREVQHYLTYLVEQAKRGTNGIVSVSPGTWPEGYFQRTAGAFAEEPLERAPQLPVERREEW